MLPAVPLLFMVPELGAALRTKSYNELQDYAADVLGAGIFLTFIMMLSITPLITITGARWFAPLRRYYGLWSFLTAAVGLAIVAAVPDSALSPGPLGRLASHAVVLSGTIAILLFIPLAMTASTGAQRRLGKHWKKLHRLVYVIWGLILLHVWLLYGSHGIFLSCAAASLPLIVLRLGPVRRWWGRQRKDRGWHAYALWLAVFPLLAVFAYGIVGLVSEEVRMGTQAVTMNQLDG